MFPPGTAPLPRRRLLRLLAGAAGASLAAGAFPRVGAAEAGAGTPGPSPLGPSVRSSADFAGRVGWAYTARAGRSRAEIIADLLRMRALGCDTLYVIPN